MSSGHGPHVVLELDHPVRERDRCRCCRQEAKGGRRHARLPKFPDERRQPWRGRRREQNRTIAAWVGTGAIRPFRCARTPWLSAA